mmetsp:Transcript_115324/g.215985  ORF Transcript_115324/g.215985 Transcript_115324/m.215985 type:complete len:217 (+) Transcript_115324:93-743(+)
MVLAWAQHLHQSPVPVPSWQEDPWISEPSGLGVRRRRKTLHRFGHWHQESRCSAESTAAETQSRRAHQESMLWSPSVTQATIAMAGLASCWALTACVSNCPTTRSVYIHQHRCQHLSSRAATKICAHLAVADAPVERGASRRARARWGGSLGGVQSARSLGPRQSLSPPALSCELCQAHPSPRWVVVLWPWMRAAGMPSVTLWMLCCHRRPLPQHW